MIFKYSIQLTDGQIFNTNHYDFSNNGNTISFTTEDNRRCICGKKFVSKIITNEI